VLEQLGRDVVLVREEGEEPVQPGGEDRAGRLCVEGLSRVADGSLAATSLQIGVTASPDGPEGRFDVVRVAPPESPARLTATAAPW
jgi:hypothetical protein